MFFSSFGSPDFYTLDIFMIEHYSTEMKKIE